jgi:hypothetical protein
LAAAGTGTLPDQSGEAAQQGLSLKRSRNTESRGPRVAVFLWSVG